MRMRLTPAVVRRLELRDGQSQNWVWDESFPTFGVYVGRRSKTYLVQFTTKTGQVKKHKIGRCDAMHLDDAKEEARRILAAVDQGADPSEAIKRAREEGVLADELPAWVAAHQIRPNTRKTWGSVIKRHILPALGNKKPSSISKDDIKGMYFSAAKISGRQANQTVVILSAFYNATTDGARNPAAEFRKANKGKMHRESEREVVLTQDQARALLDDCDRSPAQQSADVVRLLLRTGARIGEILSLEWSRVNLANGRVTIPHTIAKEGKDKTIRLSPEAKAILERRHRDRSEGARYVFPGRWGNEHQTVIRAYWAAACRRCGIEGVHVHDVRATYATHMMASGETGKAVGKSMGHADAKTTARYERIAEDRLEEMAKKADTIYSK